MGSLRSTGLALQDQGARGGHLSFEREEREKDLRSPRDADAIRSRS